METLPGSFHLLLIIINPIFTKLIITNPRITVTKKEEIIVTSLSNKWDITFSTTCILTLY